MPERGSNRRSLTFVVSAASGLRDRLTGILEGIQVEVDRASLNDDLREIAAHGEGRVLLIDRAQLPDDPADYIEQILCEDEAPALVVVTDGDDVVERAQMLAAGAAHVVDAAESNEHLEWTLGALAEAGGATGRDPEIRGNSATPKLADFISRSRAMKRFVETVERVADVDCTLLITGETGVGKERLARAVHQSSGRSGPFIGVNCGALPESLLESHLFGHEPGAFTDARSRHRGFFEQAAGGSIFLDEVAEMPPHAQVRLLTVLQRHEVQPLGAEKPIKVDVRVLAATNRDLRERVRQGQFREDLFFRLNVVNLDIPPLRRRVADIPDLVGGLVQFFRCDLTKTTIESVSEEALHVLMDYGWPGNIRELVNVVERAMILGDGVQLGVEDLPRDLLENGRSSSGFAAKGVPDGDSGWVLPSHWESMPLKDIREAAANHAEKSYLEECLRRHGGKLAEVARQSGVGTRSLYDKLQKHGLRKEDFRGVSGDHGH